MCWCVSFCPFVAIRLYELSGRDPLRLDKTKCHHSKGFLCKHFNRKLPHDKPLSKNIFPSNIVLLGQHWRDVHLLKHSLFLKKNHFCKLGNGTCKESFPLEVGGKRSNQIMEKGHLGIVKRSVMFSSLQLFLFFEFIKLQILF